MQSRYYNPEWGRFINVDSLVGETGELLSHNMFAYCSNDPVNNEDQGGDIAWWVGAAVGGAAFDSAMYLIQHRRGGATWKGLGKAAAGGAISGVLFRGAGKLASKGIRALKAAKKVKKVGKVSKGYKSKVKMNVQLLSRKKFANNIVSKGSTGPTIARNLQEQLAMKEVKSNPLKGADILTKVPMGDGRWHRKDGWVKAQRIITTSKGKINIHFNYNTITGKVDDFKFKR